MIGMEAVVSEEKLFDIVKKAVNEVITVEMAKLRLQLIPYVDNAEMGEIKEIFGSPEKYRDEEFEELEL
ncbi:MAG TPA: hypothetical protein ENH28_02935 [Euryarchaeota archaeon]|nr:hypothetical protein BMS3Bbin15_00471 [archaeon BMS3Bbin15]HDL15100.1 hypothetical protein [Euryarchaeota archaeon]